MFPSLLVCLVACSFLFTVNSHTPDNVVQRFGELIPYDWVNLRPVNTNVDVDQVIDDAADDVTDPSRWSYFTRIFSGQPSQSSSNARGHKLRANSVATNSPGSGTTQYFYLQYHSDSKCGSTTLGSTGFLTNLCYNSYDSTGAVSLGSVMFQCHGSVATLTTYTAPLCSVALGGGSVSAIINTTLNQCTVATGHDFPRSASYMAMCTADTTLPITMNSVLFSDYGVYDYCSSVPFYWEAFTEDFCFGNSLSNFQYTCSSGSPQEYGYAAGDTTCSTATSTSNLQTACTATYTWQVPTAQPTSIPTFPPTPNPTTIPTAKPTAEPTTIPTPAPTTVPSPNPTANPTANPTFVPSPPPTPTPTFPPTFSPTPEPTFPPTFSPSFPPTVVPSTKPTRLPTLAPTKPTWKPTVPPTTSPSSQPTATPTFSPSVIPTANPTFTPTPNPTANPTFIPTPSPSSEPTVIPTPSPTTVPSPNPTANPTANPTFVPSVPPTPTPTFPPTFSPTPQPTFPPTFSPTFPPTVEPSSKPTRLPTLAPTKPTWKPTVPPSTPPTTAPTVPTHSPSVSPTRVANVYTKYTCLQGYPTSSPTGAPVLLNRRMLRGGENVELVQTMIQKAPVPKQVQHTVDDAGTSASAKAMAPPSIEGKQEKKITE